MQEQLARYLKKNFFFCRAGYKKFCKNIFLSGVPGRIYNEEILCLGDEDDISLEKFTYPGNTSYNISQEISLFLKVAEGISCEKLVCDEANNDISFWKYLCCLNGYKNISEKERLCPLSSYSESKLYRNSR